LSGERLPEGRDKLGILRAIDQALHVSHREQQIHLLKKRAAKLGFLLV
jgi:hypothetical protein